MRWLDHVIAAAPNFFASAQIFSNFSTSPATRRHCPHDGHEPARRRGRCPLSHSTVVNPQSKIEMACQAVVSERILSSTIQHAAFSLTPARLQSFRSAALRAKAGAGSRIRTDDLLITNQLLYQLSYAGIYEGKPTILVHRFRPLYPPFCIPQLKSGCNVAHSVPTPVGSLSAFSVATQVN